MSRDAEHYTSGENSHFVGKSYKKVIEMLENEKWDKLFDFAYHAVIQILRELYREMDVHEIFMDADIPLFLEHGVAKGIISYPEYYEVMYIVKLAQKREVLPKYNFYEGLLTKNNEERPYDYYHDNVLKKSKQLLPEKSFVNQISKEEAIQSLRIMMDIAKNDAARHKASIYEPFLTKMVKENVLVSDVPTKSSRLIS